MTQCFEARVEPFQDLCQNRWAGGEIDTHMAAAFGTEVLSVPESKPREFFEPDAGIRPVQGTEIDPREIRSLRFSVTDEIRTLEIANRTCYYCPTDQPRSAY